MNIEIKKVKVMKGYDRGYYDSSGVLHNIAVKAYKRIDSNPQSNAEDALVAIIFSAAALEAFITNRSERAKQALVQFADTPKKEFEILVDTLETLEKRNASVRLKYLKTKQLLSRTSYDKDTKPYQDFDTLIATRNKIIHYKRETFKNKLSSEHEILKRLPNSALNKSKANMSWISRIMTPEIAKWACSVVPDMVATIDDCFPLGYDYSECMTSHVTFEKPK